MSLRVLYQAGMRVIVGIKEQASKFTDSALKNLRDHSAAACSSSSPSSSSTACSSSSKLQARRLSGAIDSSGFKAAKNDRRKQDEESLRTVMYLSCWGPN